MGRRSARPRTTPSQRRARQLDTGFFYRRQTGRRALDLHVALLPRTAASRDSARRSKIGHRRRVFDGSSADIIAAVASAGESAPNIAPIDATPAGRAVGSRDAKSSRVRSGVMPPSAKTGIAPAAQAALSPLAPHAGVVAGLDKGSKTGPNTAKSAPSRAAPATSGGE